MNAREWVAAYAAELGVDAPSAAEFATILDVAAAAAHASERVAAPVACWLCARAGLPLDESLRIAQAVGAPPEG